MASPSLRSFKSFSQFLAADSAYRTIYKQIGCPRPFDITLRDGLQSLSKEEAAHITFAKKLDLYNKINRTFKPSNVEVGSLVSYAVNPVFSDMNCFLQTIQKDHIYNNNDFVLVPSVKQLNRGLNLGVNHFSFITSVSDNFQLKNTKMTVDENNLEITKMIQIISENIQSGMYSTKLYISCINECPFQGKINNSEVINRINKLYKLNNDIICLADTCGTLSVNDLDEILKNLTNVDYKKFAMHLHVIPGQEDRTKKLIHKALDYGVCEFDTSLLKSGGCFMTLQNNKMYPNLSYELFYSSVHDYIINKMML